MGCQILTTQLLKPYEVWALDTQGDENILQFRCVKILSIEKNILMHIG